MALEIAVLGPLAMRSDGAPIAGFSRKARALIGYLAAQKGEGVSRERLADLLWPDQASEQARHSLRNCLHELRAGLGQKAFSEELGGPFACRLAKAEVDLVRFEELSQASPREKLEAAAGLYRGEFLAGLAVPAAPFEEWLGAERERLQALFCEVLQRLAAKEGAAGDHPAAITSARRLLAIDPLSEIGYRILMRAYARSGRRSEALRQYQLCASILRRDLSVLPDAETRALAAEIVRADIAPLPSDGAGGPQGEVVAFSLAPHGAQTARSRCGAVRSLALAAERKTRAVPWPRLLPGITVALSRFENLTGERERRRLAEGLTDDLVADVIERARGLSLARLTEGRGALALLAPAEKGEVGYALCGSIQNGPAGGVRINVQIREAVSGEYRWARRFELPAEKTGSLQTKITREIARELHFILLQEASRRAFFFAGKRPGLADCLARAAEALGGRITAQSTAAAQNWFLGALAREPRNLSALVGLSRTCQLIVSAPWWADPEVTETAFRVGREAVATALTLAPVHADANAIDGMLHSAAGDLDHAAKAFAEAIHAEPGYAIAHAFAAYNGAFLGRAEETGAAVERAMNLDRRERLHSIWLFFWGFGELLLGRADSALRLFEKSLARNPSYGGAQLFRGAALALCGRRVEAEDAAALFREEHPHYGLDAFAQQWLSRSSSPIYLRQITPAFEAIRSLGTAA